jgi:hypothetical protein
MGKEKEWRPLAQSHKHGPRFHDHDCFGWNRMKNRATHLASYQPIWTRPQQPQAVFFERRLSVITRASDHQKSRAPLAPVENQRTICIPKPQASLRWSYHLPMMPNSNPSRNAKSLSNVRVCQPFSIKATLLTTWWASSRLACVVLVTLGLNFPRVVICTLKSTVRSVYVGQVGRA